MSWVLFTLGISQVHKSAVIIETCVVLQRVFTKSRMIKSAVFALFAAVVMIWPKFAEFRTAFRMFVVTGFAIYLFLAIHSMRALILYIELTNVIVGSRCRYIR